jgi:DNA-binding response OmpR family regulator
VARRRKQETQPVPTGPPRVLIVNDDHSGGELERRLLTCAGYMTEVAAQHLEAVSRLGVFRPHCVLLDLSEGGVGQNLKLLDTIRSHDDIDIADMRVVLVAHRVANQLFSWEAGIDGFLARPFHADDLLGQVGEVLTRPHEERARHRRRQLAAARKTGRSVDVRAWDTQRF